MALRLRRDVQKASYYVWFLGAEEAKGLRGPRVINSVLPYLIDRSRTQEPLKVTLQVSHKGIKIVQGSSKHLIPHSAITSSTQTDDIVACVLLLYNPATKCPLHVHAYRCDSEQTAEALQQQLQILINRPENQKRFEELETRLGIMPPLPANSHSHTKSNEPHSIKSHQSQYQQSKQHTTAQPQSGGSRRHQETSPKRFSSSLGSDTGNSTRESECSEEQASNGSPISRSPPIAMGKPLAPVNNELFDSLAAELRAKLNGNGPPLLLPPRDYDTVHRSKGNLTAIELRRCRNSLIVGATTPPTAVKAAKQVSSRGSSGIGSDLAPSPERQDLNSSSDDEHWSNENDNSVIALKPSQIAMERSLPTIQHHPPLLRKSAAHIPEDSYLRDLPAKPYSPRQQPSNPPAVASKIFAKPIERETRGKSHETWAAKEDEIKPKIVRPIDYDAKFNRLIQAEQKPEPQQLKARPLLKESPPPVQELTSTKQREIEKYNELNRLKKLSLEREIPVETRYKHHKLHDTADDYDDRSERSLERERDREREPISSSGGYRKENLTDKQKFMEYTTKKQQMQREPIKPAGYVSEEAHRYGARHRYVDPADLPFEQPMAPNKYAAIHRHMPAERSPERPELGQRTVERTRESRASPRRDSRERERVMERERERVHDRERLQERERDRERERERERPRERERDRDRAHEPDSTSYSRSKERNPYREPESLPYIQSMEKMMKSKAMRYKSYEAPIEPLPVDDIPPSQHTKLSQRKSYNKHDDGIDMKVERVERDYNYNRSGRGGSDYPVAPPAAVPINGNVATKERFKEAKDKFRAMERTGSRFDLADERDGMIPPDYKPRRRGSIEPIEPMRPRVAYEEWSDEDPPVPASRSRSRSRDDWEEVPRSTNNNNKSHHSHNGGTAVDYSRRESSQKRHEPRREHSHDGYRPAYDIRSGQAASPAPPGHHQQRYHREEPPREYIRERSERDRNYSPDRRSRSELETRPPIEYTGGSRTMEKQRMRDPHHQTDSYPNSGPSSNVSGPTATGSSKGISNMPKGYRHSYAEPVFARNAGRVGLAAVNPY